MKEKGDRRDFYNRLLFFTVVSRGSHIRDNGQDTRTVSALRRQKEKATHWPALCHKLNMKTNNKERSDSPAPTETPGGELDYKVTGEGESSRRGNDPDDGIMPECGRGQSNCRGSSFNKKRKKKKRKLINIGTWNVRTLTSIGKLHLLLQELTECNMNITGLCETRWSGVGHFSSGEHTIIHSGKEKGGESGVAIVLDKTHAGCMKSYNPVSDRISTVKLNTKPAALNITQVYAPTSASTQEEAEQFYSDLQAIKDKMPKREVCIIMGDFNAKVGEGLELESGIGPFGLGERNERGEMLACFCQANGMTITNTCFKQHPRRRYTWIQPGDRARNQIDYILITNEWKTTVLNSKSRPGADCETDHILVAAKICLKAYKIVKPKQSARFDTDKLKDLKTRNQFQIEIKNRFEPLLQDWSTKEKTPNELWEEMKKCFTEVAEKNLGKRRKKPAKPYISEEVIELAKQKSKARKNGNKEIYIMLKKEIQMKLRRDKKSWLEQECAKINEWNEKRKSKELFDQIKSIQSKKFSSKNICINDVNGQALTEPDEVLKRWNNYGTHLFGYPNKKETKDAYKVAQQDVEPEPLTSEVEAAIKDLKAGKSPGLDNIPAEIIKNSGEMGIKALHHLCCQIWKQQEWPEDWKLQEFVMLYKNGNSKECGNYRTIALISHASKILLIIILNRMKCKVEEELSDCQAGYRANRGTTDMLFVLQIIIEKIRDGNEEGYITFIDYSKAFDSVIHSKLLDVMTEMGFPQHLISMIASLYHNQKATIRWNNANCEPFNIEKGVRQGCILSPHLFNLYTEQIMRQADIDDMGINIGGRDITNLRYADDTALLSDNLTSMKRILHRVNNAGQQAGLLLNAKKTKVMHIPASKESSNVEPDIKIDRTSLENVDDFKYLGSIKTSDGTCTKDINTRIAMAKQGMVSLNNIWKDRSIPKPLKFKLLKTLVWPRMLYGCETWTMRKADESKIEAAEMWFFRRLLRVSWKDRRTNGNVLAEMGTERTLLSLVKERRLKYIGHAERNTKTDLMKTIFEGKTEAKRGRGRPSLSYVDQVSKATGLKLQSISQKSQDRVIWRGIVKSSCAAANINP